MTTVAIQSTVSRNFHQATTYAAARTVAPLRALEPVDFTGRRIHFMGAGGIGVSALMELCAARGALVSGCDCGAGGQVSALQARGLKINKGHSPDHVLDCDELVFTAAVPDSHPEVVAARTQGKAVSSRMHMLGLISRGQRAVCVTGAHGKTTTTWMIAHLVLSAGRDPSILVGGVVRDLGGNVRAGRGPEFVAEVDESDNKLREVVPTIPVLTNIDKDHLEHYGSLDAIEAAALEFVSSLNAADPASALIGCGEDSRVRRVLLEAGRRTGRPVLTYGFDDKCAIRATKLRFEEVGWRYNVSSPDGSITDVLLPMPGRHNVLNSLAALAAGWRLGLKSEQMKAALSSIQRVGRRFEVKGEKRGVRVIDDYGHHPTEIRANLEAARASTTGRLAVLFQPHRYTRTQFLMNEFATCFGEADLVYLLPVYAASEEPIPGADHIALARAIQGGGQPVLTFTHREDAVSALARWASTGDTVITQGAGDVTRASDELVSRL